MKKLFLLLILASCASVTETPKSSPSRSLSSESVGVVFHKPIPLSSTEIEKLEISKVFNPSEVGKASAHFIDPIKTCEERSSDQSIDCTLFQMGTPTQETSFFTRIFKHAFNDQYPHTVRLTNKFEIQATPVTQLQWLMVMKEEFMAAPSVLYTNCDSGNQESYRIKNQHTNTPGAIVTVTICKNHPVENVSFDAVENFLHKLNNSQDRYDYRLPTEAELEYAIRGGKLRSDNMTYPKFSFGDDEKDMGLYGWYSENSVSRTHTVAQKRANGYGLYDVHGNVWQWTSDIYDSNYGIYDFNEVVVNPTGASHGDQRVAKGGSHGSLPVGSAARNGIGEQQHYGFLGFRLVRTPRGSK